MPWAVSRYVPLRREVAVWLDEGPKAKGGIILNQLLLKENEEVPENGPKKQKRGDEEAPEVFVYDIVYDDGTKAEFPQRYGVETAPWITGGKPHGLANAMLAWTVPAKEEGKNVQLFSVQ